MDCFNVNQIFGDQVDLVKIYTPVGSDAIKLLLPSLRRKCVASRYDQAPKHVFHRFAFGDKI